MEYPHVSIIIVNYNTWEDTLACLESLALLRYPSFDIVVVDNASGNDSFKQLSQQYKELIPPHIPFALLQAAENNGFAAGNNVGISYAIKTYRSAYYWLLNNDTTVATDALTELVKKALEHPRTAITGSLLLHADRPDIIQAIGGRYYPYSGKTDYVLQNIPLLQLPEKLPKVDFPIGASMLVSCSYLKEVGLMEEKYFLYFEELDWVLRGRHKNWTFAIAENSQVVHKGGETINRKSALQDYFGVRSKLLFTKKHYPYYLALIYLSILLQLSNRVLRLQFKRIPIIILICMRPNVTPDKILNKWS